MDDLSGNALYECLGVPRRATPAAVRAAFRAAARVHHPDKGGDPKRFAQLRHAFEARPARGAGRSGIPCHAHTPCMRAHRKRY